MILGQKCLYHAHPQDACNKLLELTQTHIWQFKITVIKKDTDDKLKGLDYPLLENDNEYVCHGFSFQNYLTELGYADKTVEGNGVYGKSSVDRYVTCTCHRVSLWRWKWIFTKVQRFVGRYIHVPSWGVFLYYSKIPVEWYKSNKRGVQGSKPRLQEF